MMTYFGPLSEILSTRFIYCSASAAGGGIYHNGNSLAFITVTDSIFIHNTADTVHDGHGDKGGGAMKDYRTNNYTSHYSFSFFCGNIADTNFGHDIAIHYNALSEENMISCFTTTAINAFTNAGDNETNWLP